MSTSLRSSSIATQASGSPSSGSVGQRFASWRTIRQWMVCAAAVVQRGHVLLVVALNSRWGRCDAHGVVVGVTRCDLWLVGPGSGCHRSRRCAVVVRLGEDGTGPHGRRLAGVARRARAGRGRPVPELFGVAPASSRVPVFGVGDRAPVPRRERRLGAGECAICDEPGRTGAGVVAESLPTVVAEQVWARRDLGESCEDVSSWLSRIGYAVTPDEIETIASRWLLGQDATRPHADGGPPTKSRPRSEFRV
jgi:hypothetical protein